VIRSSYGLLGIIYEVTFESSTEEDLVEYKRIKLEPLAEDGGADPAPDSQERSSRAAGFLGFLLPYRHNCSSSARLARGHRPIAVWDR